MVARLYHFARPLTRRSPTIQNCLVGPARAFWSWHRVVGLALLLLPATAAAQVSPTAPPHPTLPWALGVATPHGQLIRYIYVPPQPVTLEYFVPGAMPTPPPPPEQPPAGAEGDAKPDEAAAPPPTAPPAPTILRQDVNLPGYYVRETTVGFHYPERWMIEAAGPNVYRWRQIPPQFLPK
jgi:hypothetical protein